MNSEEPSEPLKFKSSERRNDRKRCFRSIANVILAAVVFMCTVAILAENQRFSDTHQQQMENWKLFQSDTLIDYSSGHWTDENGRTINLDNLHTSMSGNQSTLTIYSTLPKKLPNDTYLMFSSVNVFFRAYIDGELIYSYEYQPIFTAGSSYGHAYHSISLKQHAGGTLKLCLTLPYEHGGSLTNVYVGNSGAYFQMQLHQNLPSFFASFIIIVYGVVLLIISLAFHKETAGLRKSLRAFSVTTILFGAWTMEECSCGILLWEFPQLWRSIAYLPLIFLPYTLVTAGEGWTHAGQRNNHSTIFGWLCLFDFFFQVMTWVYLQRDYHDNTFVMMALVSAAMIFLLARMIQEVIYCIRMHIRWKASYAFIGFIVLFISGVMDLMEYLSTHPDTTDNAWHSRLGFIFMMILITVQYLYEIKRRLEESVKVDVYRRQAVTDSLTGYGNRAAARLMMEEMKQQMERGECSRILIGSADLNFLKRTNDQYGHSTGDKYIITASQILNKTFAPYGHIYRVGGDEFIILSSADVLINHLSEYTQRLEDLTKKSRISLSWGIAICDSPENLSNTYAEADRKMYEMKSSMHVSRS